MCLTYSETRAKIGRAKDKSVGFGVAGNTKLRVSRISPVRDWSENGAVFALVLWDTEIIRWFPDGRIGVSLNGWDTITTKRRIMDYGPGIGLGRSNGNILSFLNGRVWPGTEYSWFYRGGTQGAMCQENGENLPATFTVRAPRDIPKSRDTLTQPLPGDAFQSEPGKFWVCYENDYRERLLKAYLGDHPDNRRIAIVDVYRPDLTLSTLDLLARTGSEWKAIPRFIWSDK